jgi:hypothetical protein
MVAIRHISGAERVVYIGQHLPETKQKPVSETWKHDSNCELDSRCSAGRLCFSTRNPWGRTNVCIVMTSGMCAAVKYVTKFGQSPVELI